MWRADAKAEAAARLAPSLKEWRNRGSKLGEMICRRGNGKGTRTATHSRFPREIGKDKDYTILRPCFPRDLHEPVQNQDRSSATTSLISLRNREISSGEMDSIEAAMEDAISDAAGLKRLRAP